MLELLGEDLEDFFFGVPITIETVEENEKKKKTRPSIRTVKHVFEGRQEVTDAETGFKKTVPVKYNFKVKIYAASNNLTNVGVCTVCKKQRALNGICSQCLSVGLLPPPAEEEAPLIEDGRK